MKMDFLHVTNFHEYLNPLGFSCSYDGISMRKIRIFSKSGLISFFTYIKDIIALYMKIAFI